ncbi:DUF421 domain-containing protein [Halobacillus mangrovi]|uniref:DUF421 domain-containing protein n=1 Tax=Halobacillus mangrovi TaxID=402384 RepID=UPI003D99F26C
MDTIKVLGRIVTILPLLLFIGLFMGKRSIGELPVFDFLVVLVLGSVVGADIADPKINHIHTVIAMIAIAFVQKFVIWIKLKNRKIGKLLTFEPTVVVFKGELVEKNLKDINYSIDNIIQMLREENVFHIQDVDMGIIEANGRLSIKLRSGNEPVTKKDMNIYTRGEGYEMPIIMDGEIQKDILYKTNKDEKWLEKQLNEYGISDSKDVFYAAISDQGKFTLLRKGKEQGPLPPIQH